MSDDEQVFIPIVFCLDHASISDTGEYEHVVLVDGKVLPLTPSEIRRISNHSNPVDTWKSSIDVLNQERIHGDGLGAHLLRLRNDLVSGGKHQGGEETNAGAAANIGIVKFAEYWDPLPLEYKQQIFKRYPRLEEILGRVMRPDDVDYKEVRFCVEVLAPQLDDIIRRFGIHTETISELEEKVREIKKRVVKEMGQVPMLMHPSRANPPHVLPMIYRLKSERQADLFRLEESKDAWMYALLHAPEMLPDFREILTKNMKQEATNVRSEFGRTALMKAVESGSVDAVRLLLDGVGVNIDAQDDANDTALILAAEGGKLDILKVLLERGAGLEIQGNRGKTALFSAVHSGHVQVVAELLKAQANMEVMDESEGSVLDLAMRRHHKVLEPLLMRIAHLSQEKQEALLSKRTLLKSVLDCAMVYCPSSFSPLLAKILDENNQSVIHAKSKLNINGLIYKGISLLVLTIAGGSADDVRRVLSLDKTVMDKDQQNNGPLVWAASLGKLDACNLLLEHGVSLEDVGAGGNTALHWVIKNKQCEGALWLIEHGADLNRGNENGENALDLARLHFHPDIFKSLVKKAILLKPQLQLSLLSQVNGGKYTTIFSYLLDQKPNIARSLLQDNGRTVKKESTSKLFDTVDFCRHFQVIKSKCEELERLASRFPNQKQYQSAQMTARTLVYELHEAAGHLVSAKGALTKESRQAFEDRCTKSIHDAMPVLAKHRGWKQVLSIVLIALTFPLSLTLYALGYAPNFFAMKTDFAKKLAGFEGALKKGATLTSSIRDLHMG
ncbi:MAG: ankyrin repeat domain-containing protein [Legionellales bacterium]|nr:ankyrin repeat domain-containing protein [Legionellales bacterium]